MTTEDPEDLKSLEALLLTERLEHPANDDDFNACVQELMDSSPEKLARVLDELNLNAVLLLHVKETGSEE